ncbi:hypothetical protein AB1K54_14685 [Microbacterium sp. BWT-B31]|uniref:hypothetical protein n=1 Tax=Microbacterium sp. BWT-B31 TaxID=3232072 RepID=UPI0035279B34
MIRPLPRLGAAFAIAAAAFLVSACASETGSTSDPEAVATAPAVEQPAEASTPTPVPSTPAAEPTCETIIDATTAADFAKVNWAPRQDPFYIGSTQFDGLTCVWGDFTGPASDRVQVFGWALAPDHAARTAQDELVAQGWTRQEADGGVYITENPESAMTTDADGYGITYFFTGGTVKMADTKLGLLLVDWPQG